MDHITGKEGIPAKSDSDKRRARPLARSMRSRRPAKREIKRQKFFEGSYNRGGRKDDATRESVEKRNGKVLKGK